MSTVVRYSLMRSFSTTALIEVTCAPWMPRTVFAASATAASAALAKLSGDEPMTVMTLAIPAIVLLSLSADPVVMKGVVASLPDEDFDHPLLFVDFGAIKRGLDGLLERASPARLPVVLRYAPQLPWLHFLPPCCVGTIL